MNHLDKDTSFAETKEGLRIEIFNAPSGRGDYFCRSCKNEMVAVHRKIPRAMSYFRHYVPDPTSRKKCTYSDFEERVKVALELLQQSKSIKVPSIYMYPPDGSDGPPYKISAPKDIKAYKILTSRYFYEDSDQNLHWGDERQISELKFLLKADAVLFDQKDEILLLVVFAKSHAMNNDLKDRILCLRINTVQITLPRESVEGIGKVFQKTHHTKWLYNKDYATTKYVRLPDGHSDGIPEVDELQRRFFEENFYCRRSQITRAVRKITKYLESQQYRDAEDTIRAQIERIDQEENDFAKEYRELEERIKDEIRAEYKIIEDELESRRAAIHPAIAEISEEQRDIDAKLDSELVSDTAFGNAVSTRKREIENSIAKIGRDIEAGTRRIEKIRKDQEALAGKFRSQEEELDRDHRESVKRINDRDMYGNTELSGRIREIFEVGRIIDNYAAQYPTYVRYQKAWRSIRNGDFKNWINKGAVHSEDGSTR